MGPRQQSRSHVVWALFSLRAVLVLLLLACLGVLIYCSVEFKDNPTIAYAVVGVLLFWDISSLIRTYFLLTSRPSKIEAGCFVFIEVLMIVAAFFGGVGTLLISGSSHQCNGNAQCDPYERVPAQDWELIIVYILFATGSVHFLIFILTCIQCCTERSTRG